MFWGKKPKKSANVKDENSDKKASLNSLSVKDSKGQRSSSEDIRAQALANARKAREALGEDTIKKMAEILRKQNN